MYLTVNFLIEINNIIKPYGFDKMYMDKELIEDEFYQITDQFNERKITTTKFYSILWNNMIRFMMEMVDM